jgi:2-deoxy-D-gluconate 3-dehydrogenase
MPSPLFDLSGQVALVTGGNGGIGRAIALAFAEAGARVGILGRNTDKNQAVLAELLALGKHAIAVETDLSDTDRIEPAFREVVGELGEVSILVNNAGVSVRGSILNVELDDWNRVLQTNVVAPMLLCRLAAPSMIERRQGKIVNISSATIAFGQTGTSAYAVSKSALVQLTRCLAVELAPSNVQVNAIAPGYVETEMTSRRKGTPIFEYSISRTPAGRWAQPEEIAGTALYLASPASSYTTGEVIFVDGGYTSKQ